MDLRRLNHVLFLAEELNFARAAERAALSQSAFSRSIQALEAEIGMSLFDRGTRRVQLTPIGSILADRARAILFNANDLARELQQLRTAELGNVAVGVGPNIANSILPALLEEVHNRHPGIHLKVEVNGLEHLLPHLMAEKLDFFAADVGNLPPDDDLTVRMLPRHQIGFFCRPGHPLVGQPKPALAETLRYGLATTTLADVNRRIANRLYMAVCNKPFEAVIECDNLLVLRELVERTNLILINTPQSLARELLSGLLVKLPMMLPQPVYNQWGIVRLAGRTQTPASLLLMDMLASRAEQLREPEGTPGFPLPDPAPLPELRASRLENAA